MKKMLLCLAAVMCLALAGCEKEKSYKYCIENDIDGSLTVNEYDDSGNVINVRTVYGEKNDLVSEKGAVSVGIPPQRIYDHGYVNVGSDERYKLKDKEKLHLTVMSFGTILVFYY